jgi:hypothetical protein
MTAIIAALLLASVEGSWWYDELTVRQLHLLAMGFSNKTVEYLTSS